MRWNGVIFAAFMALGPGASAYAGDSTASAPPKSSQWTQQERELIKKYTTELAAIPNELYNDQDLARVKKFIHSNDLLELVRADPDFITAVGLMAATKREKEEAASGKAPESSEEVRGRRDAVQEGLLRSSRGDMPDSWRLSYKLGEYAYKRKDYRTSAEDYRHAYELNPQDVKSLLGYGGSAYYLGDSDLSLVAAQKALEMQPGNQEALALYNFSKGKAPSIRLPSAFPDSGENRPLSAAGVDAAAVAAPAAGTVAAMPSASGAAAASAQAPVQASRGDIERSAQFTKDAANALQIRDYPVAYTQASHAIQLNAQNAQALGYRAMALTHLGRYPDAVMDASAALAMVPGNATLLQTRSRALSQQGKYAEGLKDADETLLRDAANAFAYDNKAFALAGLRDNAGAMEALKTAARLDPQRFAARYERALQLPQDGDLTLLFNDAAPAAQAAAPMSAPGSRPRRFLRLAVLMGTGGLLIALGILHVVSASWREKVNMTVRRVLGPSVAGAAQAATPAPAMVAFWTQYELVKEIGLGGMGVVYEALDRSLERRVAVKKMRDEIRLDPQDRQRFVREAKMVAQLHHPNIVDIYGIVEDGQEIYLVFEFVEGLTLQDALKSSGSMGLAQARGVIKQVAAAVEHAHEKGVIHRDLKPSNIMLSPDGRVKVMDFGVARQAKEALSRLSMTNTVVGTPPYMAPEQEQGTVRKESDVYALGVCLYEMLTGALPFAGGGAAMLLNKLNGKHVPPSQRVPSLPADIDKVMAVVLAPDPDKRYKTPADFIAALEGIGAGRS